MENNGFERFSKAWKKSGLAGSTRKLYVEEDIKLFKMNKSKDFSRALSNSIVFDLVFKTIVIAGMLLLIWFYRTDLILVSTFVALIALSVFLLIHENGIKQEFQKTDDYSRELSVTIQQKLSFYKNHFPSLRWMLALTNALLVWVGSLYYFYFKYGYYRVEDFVDVLVNLVMVGIAFAISYYSMNFQYKFNMLELEENLADLDDEASAAIHIATQKRRKHRMIVRFAILAALGLLLFIYLFFVYGH
jgi:hypothetical protein